MAHDSIDNNLTYSIIHFLLNQVLAFVGVVHQQKNWFIFF